MSHALMMLDQPRVSYCGESALLLDAEGALTLPTQQRIWALSEQVRGWPEVLDVQPGMNSLLLVVDPRGDRLPALREQLLAAWGRTEPRSLTGKTLELEVHYGGERGMDLAEVAAFHGITVEKAVRLHAASEYLVFAPGVAPGFGFLFGLHPRLFIPRRKVPVQRPQGGGVTIGGAQASLGGPLLPDGHRTAPTGWYALGHAPDVPKPFDLNRSPPNLMNLGDRIKFRAGRIEP